MVWRALCLVLLLATTTAGCVDETKTATDPADVALVNETLTLPDKLAWGLTGCRAAVIFVDVPAAAVRPFLPAGFEPLPSAVGVSGAPANPTDGGSLGAEMFTCESGVGLNGTVPDIVYGSLLAFVEPPADLKDPDVDLHFVRWDLLVPDATRREVLQAMGAPALNGTAAFSSFLARAQVGEVEGAMDLNGTYTFAGSTAAAGPPEVRFVEFTEVPGGLVAFKTRAVSPVNGLGTATLTVPDGSLAAEILGPGSHEGTLMAVEVDFVDGTIWRIPRDG